MKKFLKLLLSFFLFLILNFTLKAQLKTLDVPLYGQQNNSWCWAASIQMVLKSYNVLYSQQSIVNKYNRLNGFTQKLGCYGCSSNPCILDNFETLPCSNPESELVSKERDRCINPNSFTNLISAHSFTMNWNLDCVNYSFNYYSNKIDKGNPIITFIQHHLNSKDASEKGFNHAIVVIGYFISNSKKYLIVNDPWKLCGGCTYAYDYESFKCNFSYNLELTPIANGAVKTKELDCSKRLYEFEQLTKQYIQKHLKNSKENQNQLFEKNFETLDSINIFEKISLTPSTFIDYEQPNYLKSSSLSLIITSKQFLDISAEIVQTSLLDRCSVLFSNMIFVSTSGSSSSSSMTLTPTRYRGIYRINKINFCNCSLLCCPQPHDSNPCSVTKTVKLENETFVIGTKKLPFKIVDYPFLNCTYRLFVINNIEYLTPTQETIFSDGVKIYSDVAYESSFIYSKLKNDTYKFYPKLNLNARE